MLRRFHLHASRSALTVLLFVVFGAGPLTPHSLQALVPLASTAALAATSTQMGDAADRTARWRADLNVFATELPRRHANAYHALSAAKFRQMVDALDRRLPQLTDAEITVELMRIASSIGDSHTGVDTWYERFHRYPIRLRWVGKDLRVMEVTGGAERAKGARLIRIGRTGINEAYARVRTLATRETELGARNDSESLFPRAEVLAALKLLPGTGTGSFTFQDDAGVTFTLNLRPISAEASSAARWSKATSHLALYEERRGQPYWSTRLDAGRVVYVKYNSCEDPARFARFTAGVLRAIDEPRTRRVIVDVRDNGGGDTSVLDPLSAGLKARGYGRRPGSLLVLTNRCTFSAAMWGANDLKELGGLLIGEAPSQLVQFYGERRSFTLPHSGLVVSYAARFFALQGRQGLLVPDVPVTRSFQDLVTGGDSVLQAAIRFPSPP